MIRMEPNTKAAADRVDCGISNVRALLSAVDDKLRVYLLDQSLFGAYFPLIRYHAQEMQTLLAIASSYLVDMEADQSLVTDALYGVPNHERKNE